MADPVPRSEYRVYADVRSAAFRRHGVEPADARTSDSRAILCLIADLTPDPAKPLGEFQKLCPPFEAHSQVVTSSLGALFKSPDLSRYELIQDISLPAPAAPMPDEVRQRLGWQKQDTTLPGAYPTHR